MLYCILRMASIIIVSLEPMILIKLVHTNLKRTVTYILWKTEWILLAYKGIISWKECN